MTAEDIISPDDDTRLSIDWVTFVIENTTPKNMLKMLDLGFILDDLSEWNQLISVQGMVDVKVFAWRNISIKVPITDQLAGYADFANLDYDSVTQLDFIYPRIFLNISGKGLKELRSARKEGKCYKDSDKECFDLDFLYKVAEVIRDHKQLNPHFSRLDIAFDFVNFQKAQIFLDCLAAAVENGIRAGKQKEIQKRSIRSDKDGITVYLGSKQSDRLLRVYDKMAEQTDSYGSWLCDPGFDVRCSDITSWVRIELQCRNRFANQWIPIELGQITFLEHPETFLKFIYQLYMFEDPEGKGSFWKDFFVPLCSQGYRKSIIQNEYLANEIKPIERIIDTYLVRICAYVGKFGIDQLIALLNSQLEFWQFKNPKQFKNFVKVFTDRNLSLNDAEYIVKIGNVLKLKGY